MEVQSEYYTVRITNAEMREMMSEAEWNRLEKLILKKAYEKIEKPLNNIDFIDDEGWFDFGVMT